MPKKDPRVDAYIERAAPFARPILKHLRKVIHRGCPQVEETIKWQTPHFEYKGILCGMAAFKQHCAFGFWKRQLIFGTGRANGQEAVNWSRRIRSINDLPDEKALIDYVRRAAELNESGTKLPKRKAKPVQPVEVPDYFSAALRKNAKARQTFQNLSPSGKREYVDWIVGAKREETRQRRLTTSLEWLSQGKPHNWRYMK